MQSLILFLIKYNAFFLFIILETIAFSLVVQNGSKVQKNAWLSSSNNITAYLIEKSNDVGQFWDLPVQNEALKKENALLKSQLKSAQYNHKFDTISVQDTLYEQRYYYTPAKVIQNSVSKQNNYITLNRGTRHGIVPNLAVISSEGLVGIVRRSSTNFSSCISLLHRDTRVSASIKGNDFFGSLVWKDKNPRVMTLEAIPKHAMVNKNDTVVTSGYSNIFPEGLMIGTVDTVFGLPGSNYYKIDVRLSSDLNKIRHVYVVQDLMKAEKVALEEQSENE